MSLQLEELLQLNQQLQNELTSLQNEKDHLTMSLQRETEARSSWEKEKVYYWSREQIFSPN